MSDVVHDEVYKGYLITIHVDDDALNPRTEFDNLGHIIGWRRRYLFGDQESGQQAGRNNNYFCDPEDLQAWLKDNPSFVLPIYMYDHSSVTIRTTPFHDPWDSGQVGYIYVTKAEVRKEWGCKRISPRLREIVLSNLRSEVETYGYYLDGEVYGYHILREDEGEGNEEVDSCWGYYGFDDVISQAKEQVDFYAKHEEGQGEL